MRRIVLTLLLLAVFLPAAAFARSGTACGAMGTQIEPCRCVAKPRPRPRPANPATTLRVRCCAIAPATRLVTPPAAPAGASSPQPDRVAIAIALSPPPPAVVRRAAEARSLAPPDPGRSLFARRCALLL